MSEETKKKPANISRRDFIRDAGIVVGGTAITSTFLMSACGKEVEVTKTITDTVTKYICPVCSQEFTSLDALKTHYDGTHDSQPAGDSPFITLTVNGMVENINVTRTETLRDCLREKFGLYSIKDMCSGYGACGSCSVIVNGRPLLSCMILACECDGAVIETAEGVAKSNPALVDAYVLHQCMQCGYCTPGFIVTAKALLDKKPNAGEEDIREILAGNICRCGTYPAHIRAIKDVVD
ncbi:MAG: 2Fe-2S iron-sulfur cluster-binding protein [Dehalococcoidales bacterium]|jgi:aerobic-type carbon monoxide dehydrogenase small subunit (CoxS/CutS family)|nr:2Fe-2S iron-sulfur cluster-binding protein [Dehalococcoidales bacterium]MDD4230497.1 2Fe-2S iron-sulfur cluster-binding protein [Dehalococcoidales bacterium]MDD4465336.1 2Fe-2S iron-sulfur cluster-binding protein [Dehalococcoidales bacterium]MDD5402364.1 2Fe-2S iron-sulfur cluster-binding protein [Dehalococcoidales bacterium]